MDHNYKDVDLVVLKCQGDKEVSVPVPLVIQSGFVRHALEMGISDNIIPVPLVPIPVLHMLLQYWDKHAGEDKFDEDKAKRVSEWEKEFFESIGPDNLYDLLVGANYIDARGCLECGAEYVAGLIREMKIEEIRKHFGIKNDFSPEEEEQLKKDFPWAYPEEENSVK